MQQNIIAVLQDAYLDNNQDAIAALGSELAAPFKANFIGIDNYGVFAEFKFQEHLFRMRYIKTEQISFSFWAAEFQTTQEFYQLVTGDNPSVNVNLKHPIVEVSYYDSIKFCEKLNQYFKIPGMKFDLPTYEEWLDLKPLEYEGIIRENFIFEEVSLNKIAWYEDYQASNNDVHQVGMKQCNVNGIYDLLGNVWEWTRSEKSDSGSLLRNKEEIVVGSSFLSPSKYISNEEYLYKNKNSKHMDLGFRIILRSV